MKGRLSLACLGLLLTSTLMAQEKTPFKVHRYAAMEDAWYVNSFWLESETGLVLIDAQMLIDDAKRLAAMMKLTGKPLAGVIITHSHADHYAGLPVLREIFGDFPIYATQETIETIPAADQTFRNGMGKTFGDRLHPKMILPNHALKSPATITLAGIPLEIRSLGPGEAADNAIVFQKDLNVIFTGDIFMTNLQQWVGEGRSEQSLAHLTYLKKHYAKAKFIYPGHGIPCSITHLQATEDYILAVQKSAKALLAQKRELKREDLMNAGAELVKAFPTMLSFGMDPAFLAALNIKGVLQEYKPSKDGT